MMLRRSETELYCVSFKIIPEFCEHQNATNITLATYALAVCRIIFFMYLRLKLLIRYVVVMCTYML